jgi:hypothetical protein
LVGAGHEITLSVTVTVVGGSVIVNGGSVTSEIDTEISVMVDGGIVMVVREPRMLVVIVEAGRVVVKSIVISDVAVKPGRIIVEAGIVISNVAVEPGRIIVEAGIVISNVAVDVWRVVTGGRVTVLPGSVIVSNISDVWMDVWMMVSMMVLVSSIVTGGPVMVVRDPNIDVVMVKGGRVVVAVKSIVETGLVSYGSD